MKRRQHEPGADGPLPVQCVIESLGMQRKVLGWLCEHAAQTHSCVYGGNRLGEREVNSESCGRVSLSLLLERKQSSYPPLMPKLGCLWFSLNPFIFQRSIKCALPENCS